MQKPTDEVAPSATLGPKGDEEVSAMPSQEAKNSEVRRQAEIRRAYEEERKKMIDARKQRDRLRVTMFAQKHA